ncbi:3-deoxy-manno-octulosonate cytidylyltransferase [Moraxella macacae 0408225]|uniref:3-deoxy-manno-octulosonate cytidylyltransferase n=1 Tax=Moraxella macacae 0408225 TaxID=1230338 RepID=L2F5S6_9GAMM|nr:3-deoxy-manno-octulosonate cytidylyltransferase [Moraxella macacae]ELA08250.1 3-deoxy-manno-octulosonate cytidylyltransferase [Moraxella macacae 0408225]
MKKHIVIPARLKSTRLPNKPLLHIHGKPMILWVIDRACAVQQAGIADDIFVATDDDSIAKVCREYCQSHACDTKTSVNIVMTDPNHASGTDRLAQVALQQAWADHDIVINMQGDEPLIPIKLIAQVTNLLLHKTDCVMATLAEPIVTFEEFYRSSVVKVVKNQHNEALYFSRSPIPCDRNALPTNLPTDTPPNPTDTPINALRHLGLYAYKVALLHQFAQWQQGQLECLEGLEQLRVIEHGHKIALDIACAMLPCGVDTQCDLDRLNAMDLSAFVD